MSSSSMPRVCGAFLPKSVLGQVRTRLYPRGREGQGSRQDRDASYVRGLCVDWLETWNKLQTWCDLQRQVGGTHRIDHYAIILSWPIMLAVMAMGGGSRSQSGVLYGVCTQGGGPRLEPAVRASGNTVAGHSTSNMLTKDAQMELALDNYRQAGPENVNFVRFKNGLLKHVVIDLDKLWAIEGPCIHRAIPSIFCNSLPHIGASRW